jgi:hypothetical protein
MVAGQVPPLLPSQASLFIYSSCEGVPSPTFRISGHPALFAMCLFIFLFQLLVYYSVCFFLFFTQGWGQSFQGAMLIWPRVVCGSTTCCLAHLVVCFSQASQDLVSGSTGALLVSPFNVEWGCYVQTGCVEMSEFCLFLVVFCARCISSVSPRFYFRKQTFSFFTLVTIL